MGRHSVADPAPSGENPWQANLGDGKSTIYMADTSNPGTFAETPPLCSGGPCGNDIVIEQDLIVWNITLENSNNLWTTHRADLTNTNCWNSSSPLYYDLISVLVHEFGHFLGVAHPSENDQTVMRTYLDPNQVCGATHARYPTVRDIKGLESAWAPNRFNGDVGAPAAKLKLFWSYMDDSDGTPEGTPQYVSKWISSDRPEFDVDFALQEATTEWGFHATAIRKDWTSVRIMRLKAGSGESWTRKTLSDVKLTHAPAITGRNRRADRWIIAGPEYKETMECSRIFTWRTWNNFNSKSRTILDDDCVFHPPSLTYHSGLNRFVMAYVRRSYLNGNASKGAGAGDSMVILRWSDDLGSTWSAPFETGYYSVAGAEVECSADGCFLQWVDGENSTPKLVTYGFSMTNNGVQWQGGLWDASFWGQTGDIHKDPNGWLNATTWNWLPQTPSGAYIQFGRDTPYEGGWRYWRGDHAAPPQIAGDEDSQSYIFNLKRDN